MWKPRPDEKPATPAGPSNALNSPASGTPIAAPASRPASPPRPAEGFRAEMAHIGKSVLIKGELSGSEDLYLDGEVEGSVELKQHSLTVGPHGVVRANVHAREIVVHGKLDGNVIGDDRVELKKSAVLMGDVSTQRIVIEDGAYFKGAIDIKKDTTRPESYESRRESALGAAVGATSGSSRPDAQSSLLEKKY